MLRAQFRFTAFSHSLLMLLKLLYRRSLRVVWCNSLLYGVPENLLKKVQSVQNAAARLLTNTRRPDHITPVLRQLHWLPVQRRVDFKIACLVHQSLASTAPTYLSADIHSWSPSPLTFIQITRCSTDPCHFRRQKLHCRRTAPVELFAGYSATDQQLGLQTI